MTVSAVILAAGKGVRMRSSLPKVMHRVAGKPMLVKITEIARATGVDRVVAVIGHGREEIQCAMEGSGILFAVQEEQLGTGHALAQAAPLVENDDVLLVLAGDTPLLKPDTLKDLIEAHRGEGSAATVLTTMVQDPHGYGRVIRGADGEFARIVEDKDASPEEKLIREINTGVYCFQSQAVFAALAELKPQNAQGEYYLTDVLEIMKSKGLKVLAVAGGNEEEFLGVNDRVQLSQAEKILRLRKCEELMRAGVTIIDPASTFIDDNVRVGQDTIIYPFTLVEDGTAIGESCVIGPYSRISESTVGDHTSIESSRVWGARIGEWCQIGPYAYLRPGSVLADSVKIGDFAEIKNSTIGSGSKVPHLSYVGDATVGREVNIGAGTITCNYDGSSKFPTVIEDGAFIGSNTNLVAPVHIGKGAFTGAGSTITRDVPPGALAVERADQRHVEGWGKRRPKKKKDTGRED